MRSRRIEERIAALEAAHAIQVPADLREASDEQLRRVVLEGIRELKQLDPAAQAPGFPERLTASEALLILREALGD